MKYSRLIKRILDIRSSDNLNCVTNCVKNLQDMSFNQSSEMEERRRTRLPGPSEEEPLRKRSHPDHPPSCTRSLRAAHERVVQEMRHLLDERRYDEIVPLLGQGHIELWRSYGYNDPRFAAPLIRDYRRMKRYRTPLIHLQGQNLLSKTYLDMKQCGCDVDLQLNVLYKIREIFDVEKRGGICTKEDRDSYFWVTAKILKILSKEGHQQDIIAVCDTIVDYMGFSGDHLCYLILCLTDKKLFECSVQICYKLWRRLTALHGDDHDLTLRGMHYYASQLLRAGRRRDCIKVMSVYLSICRRTFGKRNDAARDASRDLFVMLVDDGRYDEAKILAKDPSFLSLINLPSRLLAAYHKVFPPKDGNWSAPPLETFAPTF